VTLDFDDVILAKTFIKNNKDWYDDQIPRSFENEFANWFISNIHPAPWPVKGCPNADWAMKQRVNFPGIK
jgi:hypothetical protein